MHQCLWLSILQMNISVLGFMSMSSLELLTAKGLTKTPIFWGNAIRGKSAAIACGDLEGEALAIKKCTALPILTRVPCHRLPSRVRALDGNSVDIPNTSNIG
eukprot:c24365_g2_i2 orf=352-657(+)